MGRPARSAAHPDTLRRVRVLAARLSRLRLGAGLTQAELAASSGCTRATVCRTETGATVPTLEQVIDLARGLGVPVSALLDDDPSADDADGPAGP